MPAGADVRSDSGVGQDIGAAHLPDHGLAVQPGRSWEKNRKAINDEWLWPRVPETELGVSIMRWAPLCTKAEHPLLSAAGGDLAWQSPPCGSGNVRIGSGAVIRPEFSQCPLYLKSGHYRIHQRLERTPEYLHLYLTQFGNAIGCSR